MSNFVRMHRGDGIPRWINPKHVPVVTLDANDDERCRFEALDGSVLGVGDLDEVLNRVDQTAARERFERKHGNLSPFPWAGDPGRQ